MGRRRTWTDEDLEAAVPLSENLSQVCKALGIAPGKRTYSLLERHLTRLGLDTSHFRPRRRTAGTIDPQAYGHDWSDDDLAAAVELSTDLYLVCELLGMKPGARNYSILRRHIARLGLDNTHLPKAERGRRKRRFTDDELRVLVADSKTLSAVLRSLGYRPSGGMHRYVGQKIKNLGLNTSHFVGQGWSKGKSHTNNRVPMEEILVKNSTYMSSGHLRKRLIAEGLKDARCERCGIDAWLDQPLPLALDHINGNHTDNRLENLRILCPNCHALTPTWCNNRKRKVQ